MKNLLKRTLTGALIVIITTTAIVADEITFVAFIELIFLLGITELSRIVSFERDLRYLVTLIAGAIWLALVFLFILGDSVLIWFAVPAGLFLLNLIYSRSVYRSTFRKDLYFLLPAIIWLVIPLSLFMGLGWVEDRKYYWYAIPLSVIVLIWINDTGAYLIGSRLGKHKMTPHLSPNKTWEGFFGGMLITMFAGWIIYKITGIFTPVDWLIISLTTVVFGLLGDLLESRLKREFKVKDSGSLLPGHGGILDRFDSLLLAAPAVFVVIAIIMLTR